MCIRDRCRSTSADRERAAAAQALGDSATRRLGYSATRLRMRQFRRQLGQRPGHVNLPRIEDVAQGIAEDVEREYRRDDGEPGAEEDPPGADTVADPVEEDRAPAGCRRLRADAEIRQSSLEGNHVADAQRSADDDGSRDVRKQMATEHRYRRGAECACRNDEIRIANRQDLGAYESRDAKPTGRAEQQDET